MGVPRLLQLPRPTRNHCVACAARVDELLQTHGVGAERALWMERSGTWLPERSGWGNGRDDGATMTPAPAHFSAPAPRTMPADNDWLTRTAFPRHYLVRTPAALRGAASRASGDATTTLAV